MVQSHFRILSQVYEAKPEVENSCSDDDQSSSESFESDEDDTKDQFKQEMDVINDK